MLERKRFEPPTGNHWIHVTDGEVTAWATMGRKRAEAVLAVVQECGFDVERA